MKKFLLLALLLGLPSPLLAGESTSGYKKMDSCETNDFKFILYVIWICFSNCWVNEHLFNNLNLLQTFKIIYFNSLFK